MERTRLTAESKRKVVRLVLPRRNFPRGMGIAGFGSLLA